MRALCGAIISAGALIGLGLVTIGIGNRYAIYPYRDLETGKAQWVYLKDMDTALLLALVAALAALIVGLGIAFLGLAYHHHRRHLEMLHRQREVSSTPGHPPASERITV